MATMANAVGKDGKPMGDFMKQYRAVTQSYMSMPVMLGAGALFGMTYADHHGMSKTQGALLGMAGGFAVRGGAGVYDWWTEDMAGFGKKTLFTAGASTAILAHGIMNRDYSTVYGSSADSMTGQTEYGGPIQEYEEAAPLGLKDRLHAMAANGNVVLGSHNRRHG
jgi:hypothetical protein